MKIDFAKALYQIELANINKRISNQGVGLSTGFPDLDNVMGGVGFEPGYIYTIAGRPGMGKTALLLNLVINNISRLAPNECIVYVST